MLSVDFGHVSFADICVMDDTVMAPGWVGGEESRGACVTAVAVGDSPTSAPATTLATWY